MNARERLRKYLEQRRELGETDLVLDELSVEEALAIISGSRSPRDREEQHYRPTGQGAVDRLGAPNPAAQKQALDAPIAGESPRDGGGDNWRDVLRAAGAAPGPIPVGSAAKPGGAGNTPIDVLATVPPGLVIGAAGHELFGGANEKLDSLAALAGAVASCTRCPLHATATNPVPGEGSPTADLMCVGEAPGATEDETGRPFVGQAGQLLTKILAAIQLGRDDVFICNVLKHRPPGNRNPLPDEIAACSPHLIRQIELIRPKVILALGTFAAQTLLATKLSIGKLRGQIHRYYGVPLIVTYHPAALLRNPAWKRPTWEDVQLARRILDSTPPANGA